MYFFRRGQNQLTCETRLNEQGPGYELAVTTDGVSHVEPFTDLAALLAREHELVQAWRAMGWRESTTTPAEAAVDPPDENWLSRRG